MPISSPPAISSRTRFLVVRRQVLLRRRTRPTGMYWISLSIVLTSLKSRFAWSYRFPDAPGTSGSLMPTEPASPWPSARPLRSASPAHRSAALVFFSSSSPPCACPPGPPLSGRTYSDITKLFQRLTAHHVGDPFPLFCRKGRKLYFSTFCFDDIGVCNGQIASPPG